VRKRVWIVSLVSTFLIATIGFADDAPLCRFTFKGAPSASGKFTNLELNVQAGSPKAFRLYAEPSHTLLGVYLNNSDGAPESQPWFAGVVPPGANQIIQVSLREGTKALLQGPRPLLTDTHIHIFTVYETANGHIATDLFRLATRVSDFQFGLEILPKPETTSARDAVRTESNPGGIIHKITCGSLETGSCQYSVANCTSEGVGRCCWTTDPTTSCGWCGKVKADCLTTPCGEC
jgi:hypothetical protein